MTMRDLARFWSRVNIENDLDCWEWRGGKHERGYGVFKVGGLPYRASRLAWELFNGQSMGAMYACHKCDNPACCNPDHIFPGTQKQNMQDMLGKGRQRKPIALGATFEL